MEKHAKISHTSAQQKYTANNMALGLCVSNKSHGPHTPTNKYYCQACCDKRVARNKTRRQSLVKQGLCKIAGSHGPALNSTLCDKCLSKHNLRQKALYSREKVKPYKDAIDAANIEAGLCRYSASHGPATHGKICAVCARKRADREKEARRKKKSLLHKAPRIQIQVKIKAPYLAIRQIPNVHKITKPTRYLSCTLRTGQHGILARLFLFNSEYANKTRVLSKTFAEPNARAHAEQWVTHFLKRYVPH